MMLFKKKQINLFGQQNNRTKNQLGNTFQNSINFLKLGQRCCFINYEC